MDGRSDGGRKPRSVRRRRRSESKVRVHRISSRYPVVEVRTRMDSYGAPKAGLWHAEEPTDDDDSGGGGDGNGEENDSRRSDFNDLDDDFDDDGNLCGSRTDTAAGCSSASDTDFYYEDRTDCHRMHKTVVELRAEEVERTETVQEEFEDSLIAVQDHRLAGNRTVEVVTKHRHVLSDSCRVKVQNLRYAAQNFWYDYEMCGKNHIA